MRRRSPALTALLAVVALVLLPAISNVEANALPTSWTPLLWLAWPAGLLLAVPLVYLEIRRNHRPGQAAEPAAAAQAVTDLAAAVTRQWTDELARRSVHRGAPLRVCWKNTALPVARDLADVMRDDLAGQVTAVSGDTAGQLVTVLDSLRDGQVVVLGEPGAGKTVLAVQFALHALEHRATDDPVPVLLTLSSWDPATEGLRTWLARRIVEDYPALGNEQVYGVDATTAMVTDGRVLAVLDGLDEMPAAARRCAVVALDHAAGTGFPMVVTSRRQEYEDAVAKDGVFLGRAAVLEMLPVDLADARRYLLSAAPAGASPWPPVLDRLDARPYTPLARVLASPLMIALARTVYAGPASCPRELLNRKRFRKQEQIERHLLDEFIDATYRDTPVIPETTSTLHYPPERARHWLTFLARYLSEQQTGELAWWRLFDSVPRAGRALVAGVTIGLVFGLTDALAAGVVLDSRFGPPKALALGLASGAGDGLAYGLVGALIGGLGRPRRPTRVQLRFHRTLRSFLGRFAASFGLSVVVALVAGMHVLPAIGIAVVVGLTFTAQVWLDAPGDATETPTPGMALRQNRTAAWGFGLTLAVGFGAFEGMNYLLGATQTLPATGSSRLFVIVVLTLVTSGCLGYVLYGWIGCAVVGLIEAGLTVYVLAGPVSGRLVGVTFVPFSGVQLPDDGTVGTLFGIAFGLTVGVAGVVTRAWGNFCLVRVWLALRGHLPWRLMRFLDDAHRRGVLRQTGAVYQFRHARLQDQLVRGRSE